jgi:hypothetical protein
LNKNLSDIKKYIAIDAALTAPAVKYILNNPNVLIGRVFVVFFPLWYDLLAKDNKLLYRVYVKS